MPTTPVVPGLHPDPSIARVGDTSWMVCSSLEYATGVPLFRSTDLVTWKQVGHVLSRPSQLDVTGARASGGIFPPTLRYHDGRLWMITTNTTDRGWQVLVTAASDLDLVVRLDTGVDASPPVHPARATAATAAAAAAAAATALGEPPPGPTRVDVLLEPPAGAVARAEGASGAPMVLLRTADGPRLVPNPWLGRT